MRAGNRGLRYAAGARVAEDRNLSYRSAGQEPAVGNDCTAVDCAMPSGFSGVWIVRQHPTPYSMIP